MGCGTSNIAAVAAEASDSSIVDSEEKKEQAWSYKKGSSSSNKRRMEETSKSAGADQPKRTVSFPGEESSETTDSDTSRPKLTRKDTPHVLSNLPAAPVMKAPELAVQKEEGAGSVAGAAASPMKQKPEALKPLTVRQPLSLEGTESQIEFFKKIDKRIEQGPDYVEEKGTKK